jgi:2-C-methyl-D-erythritol 4-phosphate cytidylyltransferase
LRGVVLLLAAGQGVRLGSDEPKAFLQLAGSTVLRRSAGAALSAELVDSVVVAAPNDHVERASDELTYLRRVIVVPGGPHRQASARAALDAAPATDAFLVHDAARALAPSSLFDACLRELDECDACVPALPLSDTVKEVSSDHVVRTLDRSVLAAVQTPQAFRADVYRRAHREADASRFLATDDAALVERLGVNVRIIPGDDRNMKITTPHDVAIAEALLRVDQ